MHRLKNSSLPHRSPVAILCFAWIAFSATISLYVPSSFCESEGGVLLGHHPQIFLDDELVSATTNLLRKIHPLQKHSANPVLVQEHPWEKRILEIYGTVLFDPARGKFRCWYLGNEYKDGIPDNPEHPRTAEYYTCYAESQDGVVWNKPLGGTEPFGNHPRHNIVIPNTHGFCVLPTPEDPDPERKYKGAGGAVFGTSPDGIQWTLTSWREAIGKNDTSTCLIHWKGQYLAFVRAQVPDPQWPGVMRGIGLSVSTDFQNWSPKETVLTTDAMDGYPWTQPYGISVAPYGDVLIGFLWLLHLDEKEGNNKLGTMDVQLVASRDGRNWTRVGERETFLAPSPGEWDRGGVFPGTSLIVRDDVVSIYYTGVDTRHGEGWGKTSVGLATLPADRFVGWEQIEKDSPGVMTTKTFKAESGQLLVNAQAEPGDLTVEVLDPKGVPIPGFGAQESRLTRHDDLRYEVTWDVGAPPTNTPISLRFVLTGGQLFSFQFAE
jgi:hypothetical protein